MLQGPAVLLLGQNYLRLETGVDPLLNEILRKYGKPNTVGVTYREIFESDVAKSPEVAVAWMQQRSELISIPKWLEVVAKFPWSNLYTSAIDSVWARAFRVEWRELHYLFDEKYKPLDLRNRTRLHCTQLYGNVSRTQENERPPLDNFEFLKRKQVAIALARRLPEIITPFGALLIEGYSGHDDWFSTEDLLPIIDSLNTGQTHLFSIANETHNTLISELARRGKIVVHPESLSTFLDQGETAGFIKLGRPPDEEEYGRRIKIRERVLTVPTEIWNRVSKSAHILDDTVLIPPPQVSNERKYREFRNFLAESSAHPVWTGYARGFAFTRDCQRVLHERVSDSLMAKESSGKPIILHGQTGTGKTVALGAIAYALRAEARHPVLFIERKSLRPVQSDLDTFCMWAENQGVGPTIIVWDGMVESELYHRLSQYLGSRGRRALIVGSCYKLETTSGRDFIEAPATLTPGEIGRFGRFLDDFEPKLSRFLDEHLKKQDDTFLSALYRLLPPTRDQIQMGVVKEIGFAEQEIQRKLQEMEVPATFGTTLGHALISAGIVPPTLALGSEKKQIGTEEVSQLEELIGLIMVPGRFGLFVPIEILLRALGKEAYIRFSEILSGIDIFRWYEDGSGNVSVGPRNALEARIVAQARLGGAKTEMAFARQLIAEVRDSAIVLENPELQFVVDLIRNVGPNGREATHFSPYFQDLSETLRHVREDRGIQHPRLMLQEATILRETVVANDRAGTPLENAEQLLDEEEKILRQAIEILSGDSRSAPLRSQLLVELGSLLGTRLKHVLSKPDDFHEAATIYGEARDRLFEARASDPENYYLIDVLSWTVSSILQTPSTDLKLRAEAEADILHAFEMAEDEEFGAVQQERFQRRRMEIAEELGRADLTESAFQNLVNAGSAAGYYLRASRILGVLPRASQLSSDELNRCQKALEYLESNIDGISSDGRCLYLLLRLWWLVRVGRPLFDGTRIAVPLSSDDWTRLLELLISLMGAGESYYKPSLRYLQGLTDFHLGQVESALDVFSELRREVAPVRRRVLRSYLASTPQGVPRTYHGSVKWVSEDRSKGDLYVEEIRRTIPFFPRDFNRPDIQVGETINGFHIAFNYLGPLADPPGFFRTQQG
jgi:hypothetical protein